MSKKPNNPNDLLKYHVTGAIKRGEKQAIEAVVSKPNQWTSERLLVTNDLEGGNPQKLFLSFKAKGGEHYDVAEIITENVLKPKAMADRLNVNQDMLDQHMRIVDQIQSCEVRTVADATELLRVILMSSRQAIAKARGNK